MAEISIATRLTPNLYRDYPYLTIDDFLEPRQCRDIVAYAQKDSDAQHAEVKSTIAGSVVDPSVDLSIRKAMTHTLPETLLAPYHAQFLRRQKEIEAFFSIALTTATAVQSLAYRRGDFYIRHADDSSEILNTKGKTVGFVQMARHRKLTSVLFAASHCDVAKNKETCFNGGELVFSYLYERDGTPVTLRPKAGTMVVFPSNPIYSHEVRPVHSGYRLTLVQWHDGIIT